MTEILRRVFLSRTEVLFLHKVWFLITKCNILPLQLSCNTHPTEDNQGNKHLFCQKLFNMHHNLFDCKIIKNICRVLSCLKIIHFRFINIQQIFKQLCIQLIPSLCPFFRRTRIKSSSQQLTYIENIENFRSSTNTIKYLNYQQKLIENRA